MGSSSSGCFVPSLQAAGVPVSALGRVAVLTHGLFPCDPQGRVARVYQPAAAPGAAPGSAQPPESAPAVVKAAWACAGAGCPVVLAAADEQVRLGGGLGLFRGSLVVPCIDGRGCRWAASMQLPAQWCWRQRMSRCGVARVLWRVCRSMR